MNKNDLPNYRYERIKLTVIYSAVLGVIIVIMSFIILQIQNTHLNRIVSNNANRIATRRPLGQFDAERLENVINDIKRDNLNNMVVFDVLLLIPSIVLSYYLSNKTLEPIIENIRRQKQFIYDASHEFKTPITNIKTEAEVLLRSEDTNYQDLINFTKHVIEEVDRINVLINLLLESARSGSLGIKKQFLEVNKLLIRIVQSFEERIKSRDLRLEMKLSSEEIYLESNEALLERVFSILIDNAIKYNKEKGTITIKTYFNSSKKPVVSITDSGVGIEKKDLERIFDRFYRVGGRYDGEGFGMGLAIAREIAQELGINMDVKSKLGVGSEFTLEFQ